MQGQIITELLAQMFANNGGEYITTSSTDNFMAIQVVSDCVITTTGNLVLTSVSLSEGQIIYGRFESVTLASGEVIAYKMVEL
jgi:hypothetical protein